MCDSLTPRCAAQPLQAGPGVPRDSVKRVALRRTRRQAGYASVAWLALLVALGCAAMLFWQSSSFGPGRSSAQYSDARPDSASIAAGPGAAATPAASAAAPGDAQPQAVDRRLARLEELFPEGLAQMTRLRDEHRAALDERDRMAALYRQTLNESSVMLLDEVESLLALAARQLDTGADTAGPMALVEAARARAARRDSPIMTPLVLALDADLESLRQAGQRSVRDAAARLSALLATIDTLPFEAGSLDAGHVAPAQAASAQSASADAATPATRDNTTAEPPPPWWQSMVERSSGLVDLERARGDAGELVRVRRVGESDASILPPTARYFVLENLRLRLMSARLSLLLRDPDGFERDRAVAMQWLGEHFEADSPAVKAGMAALTDLAGWRDQAGRPDVERSLAAVARLRAALPAAGSDVANSGGKPR